MESVSEKQGDFYLASAPVRSLILRFAIPCILSMLVSALYNFGCVLQFLRDYLALKSSILTLLTVVLESFSAEYSCAVFKRRAAYFFKR